MRMRCGLLLVGMLVARTGWAHNYVGAQSCATCHAFEYRVWSQSPHARAHQSLSSDQLADTRCSVCHTTPVSGAAVDNTSSASLALREPTAASLVTEPAKAGPPLPSLTIAEEAADKATPAGAIDPRFLGVQCEACHGPGALYQPDYVMRDRELARLVGLIDPTPAMCQGCHTEGAPSLTPFDFKTAWARIDHGREARLAYEAAIQKDEPVAPVPPAPAAPSSVKSRAAMGPKPVPRHPVHRGHHRVRGRSAGAKP